MGKPKQPKGIATVVGAGPVYTPTKPTKTPRNRPGRARRKPYRGQGRA